MVGSAFIHTKRGGRLTLLNVAQITAIYTKDIDVVSGAGRAEYSSQYALEEGTIYTIQVMLTSRREFEYVFATAVERDEMYEQMVAAVSPAVVIESIAPFLPAAPEVSWSRFRKPSFPNEVFATEEEYDRALASVMEDLKSGKTLPRPPESPSASTPPAPAKPPRKPRTPPK